MPAGHTLNEGIIPTLIRPVCWKVTTVSVIEECEFIYVSFRPDLFWNGLFECVGGWADSPTCFYIHTMENLPNCSMFHFFYIFMDF